MSALLFTIALESCTCAPVDASAAARVERLRAELRDAEHAARMEQLAEVARKVNAGIAKRERR